MSNGGGLRVSARGAEGDLQRDLRRAALTVSAPTIKHVETRVVTEVGRPSVPSAIHTFAPR